MSGLYQYSRIEQKLDQLLAGGGGASAVAALPPGYVGPFMAGAIPDGWAAMDGRALAIADNPVLYALFADRYSNGFDEFSTRWQASNLVPLMTSDTSPSGFVASASSFYAIFNPYKAFNGVKGSGGDDDGWVLESGVFTGWLRIDLPVSKGVTSYSITARSLTANEPSDFTFEGSNDGGATWTVLDTRTGEINWPPGSTRSYELDTSQLAATYSSFRLNVTASSGTDSFLAIGELTINGGDPVFFGPTDPGQFRVPNLKSSPADLPGSVWCVKLG